MRLQFQYANAFDGHGNIYRDFSPRTYYPSRVGVNGLGLGASPSIQQITAAAGAIGSAIPIAGPFIAAAASIAVSIENLFRGCGQTCVETSNAANQAANLLTQNVQAYVNSPIRTLSMQAAALQTFDNAWAQLVQLCSNPQFGQAGQNCIADRQRGACHYKTSPGGWNSDGTYTWAGAAGSGSTCWNWFSGMRDPIANDPFVIPDSSVGAAGAGSSTSLTTTGAAGTVAGSASTNPISSLGNLSPLLLVGGGIALLLAVTR